MEHLSAADDERCAKAVQQLCAQYGKPFRWRKVGAVMAVREAYIYRVAVPELPTDLAVKLFRHRYSQQRQKAQAAFEQLQESYSRCTRHWAVPRPYTVVPKHAAIVVEWVEGLRLSELLRRQNENARAGYIHRAGEWLRWFHEGAEIHIGPYAPIWALTRIRRLRTMLTGKEARLVDRHLEILERASGHFSTLQLPYARLHADFTPLNLLMEEERVIGIDFAKSDHGPVSRDVCRFLVYADIYQFWLTRASSLRRYGCRRSDYEAFMQGYGLLSLRESEFLYLQYTEITRRLASLLLLAGKRGFSGWRWLELFRIKRMARHAAAGLAAHIA